MNTNRNKKWSYLYKKSNYQIELNKFILKTNNIFDNYEKISVDDHKVISHEYYEMWKKTMNTASSFLHDNVIPAKEDKDIVNFLINSDVFINGEKVFLLYRGMCNLKKNNFILPKKYYGDKYINIFKRFGYFFLERIELEKRYAMDI